MVTNWSKWKIRYAVCTVLWFLFGFSGPTLTKNTLVEYETGVAILMLCIGLALVSSLLMIYSENKQSGGDKLLNHDVDVFT